MTKDDEWYRACRIIIDYWVDPKMHTNAMYMLNMAMIEAKRKAEKPVGASIPVAIEKQP